MAGFLAAGRKARGGGNHKFLSALMEIGRMP
jgi:hypothetical protein